MNRLEAFEYHSDTRVLFGQGCIAQLGDAVRRLSSGPVLLVTDPGIVAAGLAARALASLDSAGRQARSQSRRSALHALLHEINVELEEQ